MPAPRYRAFLSYSHRDTRLAWLIHWRLERFRIPQALRGRPSPIGPIPDRLHPIFLDRFHFSAGRSLNEQTIEALKDSAALILLGSPNAARSTPVNLEVQIFRGHHLKQPIAPLILSGSPSDPDNPCFPPALLGILGPNPVAADWHKDGDRGATALAKIVAQLLGVAPIDIRDHFKAQQRRERLIRVAAGALVGVLSLGGGYAAYRDHQSQQELTDPDATARRLWTMVNPARAAPPGALESLSRAVRNLEAGAGSEPKRAHALALLNEGKITEATALLEALAAETKATRLAGQKREAEDLRTLGGIAGLADPKKAREAYAEAARLDPDDVEGMYLHGYLQADAGNLPEAEAAFRRVLTLATTGNDWAVYWSRLGLGDILVERGDLAAAKTAYQQAGAAAERLAKSDPNNAGWQRNLSVSYNRVGDVQVSQGGLPDALRSYRDALSIAERLAKSDPNNAGWQRDLSVSYDMVGDVQVSQGSLPDALRSYRDALSIAERLAKLDPNNAGWQRDLSVSYTKVGDVQVRQGSLPDALRSYRDGLSITESLAQSDPNNAGWQRDLSVSYNKVGDVQVSQGSLPDALRSYRDGLSIRERLAKSDPNNAGWQRDLSVSYTKVGDVQVRQGTLPDALRSYRDGLSIAERLAKSDPNNAGWQNDLSASYTKVGDVQVRQGTLPDALRS